MMGTDTLFEEILERLGEIHTKYPDLRFGLVLQSALDMQKKKSNSDLHNYSSKVILKALDNFESKTRHKRKVIE